MHFSTNESPDLIVRNKGVRALFGFSNVQGLFDNHPLRELKSIIKISYKFKEQIIISTCQFSTFLEN